MPLANDAHSQQSVLNRYMKTKKGLGKGLDALLGASRSAPVRTAPLENIDQLNSNTESSDLESIADQNQIENIKSDGEQAATHTQARHVGEVVVQLGVERCQRGKYQPRRVIDSENLEELAASIRQQGIMQPIVVRPIQDASVEYEIIAGERRWRAAQLIGLNQVPAIVREVSDEAAIAMALIENLQRENLNPMDEAYALHRLQQEFEMTHQEVADAVGKSRSAVSNAMRLMGLGKEVKLLLENGDIEMGHARSLLSLTDHQQSKAAVEVVEKCLSVRQTESLVKALLNPIAKNDAAKISEGEDANIKSLETDLSDKLGAGVTIQHHPKGKGKLVITYNSLDELDGILAHIR